jgi:hypothetical protein
MKAFFRGAAMLSLAACLALSLEACSGSAVGSGNAPTALVITLPGSGEPLVSLRAHACLPSQIGVLLRFKDGSFGNFTNRVVWSSSNAGVLAVSNGDYPVPGHPGSFYPNGALIPLSSGAAEITATFSTLTSTVAVSVGTLDDPTLKEVVEGIDVVPPGNSFRMGVATTQNLHATARLDGVETDISFNVDWGFRDPNTSVATIVGQGVTGGVITGVGLGGPVVAQATLPLCPLVQPSMNVSVLPIQGLSIQPQYAGNPFLIVGNSERIFTFADLGNGPEQDISAQAAYTSTNTSALIFNAGVPLLGQTQANNYLKALAPGGTVIEASFTKGGRDIESPTLVVGAISANLGAITVTGAAPSALFPGISLCDGTTASIPTPLNVPAGSLTPTQFCALGSYGAGLVQDVTPEVTWSISDPTLGSIGTTALSYGQLLASTGLNGALFVTATTPAADDATVIVNTATVALIVDPLH